MKLFSFEGFLGEKNNLSHERSGLINSIISLLVVFSFTFFPLLFDLPYRDNLYLTWEGTYRLYLGQIPYKDFGMPIGYGYFIIPLLFFKIFGPFLRTLLYAQVLINLLTIYFFNGILKALGLNQISRSLSLLVFIVSYTFSFFWPWYNNTALMFELGGLFFLLNIPLTNNWKYYASILLAGLFVFLSFFTKQDYGGLAFLLSMVLIFYHAFINNDFKRVFYFILTYTFIAILFIYPFLKFDFLYWFNYGQSPHQSRLSINQFLNEFFANSAWEKFYLIIMIFLFFQSFKGLKSFISNRNDTSLFIICFGLVIQNLITKVTSRLPLESTTYFHGFAFAYLISHLNLDQFFKKRFSFILTSFLIFLWWSSVYWKYANRIFKVSDKSTTKIHENEFVGEPWKPVPYRVYRGINLPSSTINGIERIKKMKLLKQNKSPKILNMSELTPLAYEFNYLPQNNLPLWYHLNIGMFQKQVKYINNQIDNKEYDMVLFEVVPGLDNFYPFEVRDQLIRHYSKVDSFMAPRKLGDSHIEVFVKK